MKKQTAVEYLIEMIRLNDKDFYAMLFEDKVIEQAKEMEYEQIIDAYKADMHPCSDEDAEQYYNETFEI
jgi:hypothetical protein